MATFETLPVEIRLCIYGHMFPKDSIQSLQPLGFRNPTIESPPANVHITLPISVLMQLYYSNPAGESKGRFWDPIPLFAVSKEIAAEAGEVWGRLLINVSVIHPFLMVSDHRVFRKPHDLCRRVYSTLRLL